MIEVLDAISVSSRGAKSPLMGISHGTVGTGSGSSALLRAVFEAERICHLGYASFAEYVERLFGYKPRATEEKLRVAQALESLPEMNRALRDGELTWSATSPSSLALPH